MGASGWAYFVPYQPDLQKALDELRQAVFEAGDYYTAAGFYSFALKIVDNMPEELRQMIETAKKRTENDPKPQSIEELIEMNAESGTHSIIDIDRISVQPDFGAVAPLTADQLILLFGTDKPSHEMVEAKVREIREFRDRWNGTYIIVYKDDMPDEIFFCGFSGD